MRELFMPLHQLLETDPDITHVYCVTPAAQVHDQIFLHYSDKFSFHENPTDTEGYRKLFQELQPDLVVTDTVGHDVLDYPIVKVAQELDIASLTFIASWDNVWKIKRLLNDEKPVAVADKLIVWNQMMKDHLLHIFPDLTAGRINVVGAPRLDYFFHEVKIPSKQALYEYLGFSDVARPLIHFATTELYPMDYVVEAVQQAIASKEISYNPHLYASVHPGGKMKNHEGLRKLGVTVRYSFGRLESPPHPAFSYRPTEEELYMLVALFKHADLLINHSSSTALESLLGNTPVINVKFGKPLDWWRWYRSMVYRDFHEHYKDLIRDGATYVVNSKKQLIKATEQALKNQIKNEQARQLTLQRMITTTDGTASQKTLNVLKETAAKT